MANPSETKQQQPGGEAQPRRSVQADPRFNRPPNREPGYETRLVCGYGPGGETRDFHLLKGEALPDGWSDAPPEGTHPNQQKG